MTAKPLIKPFRGEREGASSEVSRLDPLSVDKCFLEAQVYPSHAAFTAALPTEEPRKGF